MKTYCAKIIYAKPERVCPNGYLISEKILFNYTIKNGERIYFTLEKLIQKANRFIRKYSAPGSKNIFLLFEIVDCGFVAVPFISDFVSTDDKKKGG